MKKLMFIAWALISSYVNAGVETFKIKGLGFSDGSQTVFVDVETPHSQSDCSNKGRFRYDASVENSYHSEIYSSLLAAFLAGKSVEISFTNDASECIYSSPQIKSIYIK